MILRACLLASLIAAPPALLAQSSVAPRAGIAAGLGVEEISLPDVTGLINVTVLPSDRAAQFTPAAEFFGTFSLPLSGPWLLKLEYAYDIASSSRTGAFGPASFGVTLHLPSLILQYALADEGLYNLKAGAGFGYHFGTLHEQYLSLDDRFSGGGPGALLDLEANTAFGDHLYAYLGANLRWEFIGTLTDAAGVSPGLSSGGALITLHGFGAGVRLGACYLL